VREAAVVEGGDPEGARAVRHGPDPEAERGRVHDDRREAGDVQQREGDADAERRTAGAHGRSARRRARVETRGGDAHAPAAGARRHTRRAICGLPKRPEVLIASPSSTTARPRATIYARPARTHAYGRRGGELGVSG